MFIYLQSSGALYQGGTYLGSGYSGHGEGLNNGSLQFSRDVGPIPVGDWIVGNAFTHAVTGVCTMRLSPADGKAQTQGRSGFLIHGDNSRGDRSASRGCIILARDLRDLIARHPGLGLAVLP